VGVERSFGFVNGINWSAENGMGVSVRVLK